MIKNLKNKFLICLFLLVTVFSVTSSCFANSYSTSIGDAPINVEDFMNSTAFYTAIQTYTDFKNFNPEVHKYAIIYKTNSNYYHCTFFLSENISCGKERLSHTQNMCWFDLYDTSGKSISVPTLSFRYENGSYSFSGSNTSINYFAINDSDNLTNDINFLLYGYTGDLWHEPVIPIDISFNYEFEGVKRGQTKLTITNLDSSLKMYGYVGCDNNFSVGDILDTSSISSYLRLLSVYSDNSDLYCYMYDGEELLYYILDENNVILGIGYISNMAKGDFLYGFNVSNGVDFVFLRDGIPYWDNNLTFKYNTNNSNTIQNNDVVSMGDYSYIETSKTVASGTYTGYVFDSSGNLVVQADCAYSNNLSSFSIKVDTSYFETHTLLKHISCYWLQSITLTGTNPDGSFIDFSNYKVQWSVPTWVTFESIELGFEEYNMRSGTLTGFTSAGALSMFNLQLYENLSEHSKNFDITLQVYDGSGNLVLTHIVNSDNIVDNQIKSEENNVDKGDYDIVDKPGYTGGSNSNYGDIGNIQNWTADDYINLMSTDNFVWEFFKAILGNLPWWITTPLTILIFGVVIITIIRFARGA